MAALNSLDHSQLITQLQKLLPEFHFVAENSFYWSPEKQKIAYATDQMSEQVGIWSLLHEAGHARLGHNNYTTDFELLLLEVAAWDEAKLIASQLSIDIDDDHIQDCLDTYRDWLHKRSTCPTCGNTGLQYGSSEYHCHNCHSQWTVTASRFCRPYRKKR